MDIHGKSVDMDMDE